jgi:outer membrane protein TolC
MKKLFFWLTAAAIVTQNSKALTLSECIQKALAQKALEIAQVQYAAGVIPNLEELDAELAAQSAETACLAVVSGYLIAKARLEKAMGEPIQ